MTIKKIQKNRHNWCGGKKGFSFIESMLAVFLVSVGIVAGLKLLTVGLKDSMISRDQFIASLLAQEGVELVRNIRDNDWVDGDPNTGSFDNINSGVASNNCIVDYNSPLTCNASPPANYYKLYLKTNFYDHNNSAPVTDTKLQRKITIGVSGDSRIISSIVNWNGAAPDNDVTKCNTANKCAYTQITLNKWGE